MKRCRHDIFSNMLEEAKEGAVKTNLMYAARLSYTQLESYLKTLEDTGLLENRGRSWITTEKGERFLEAFQTVQMLMEKGKT